MFQVMRCTLAFMADKANSFSYSSSLTFTFLKLSRSAIVDLAVEIFSLSRKNQKGILVDWGQTQAPLHLYLSLQPKTLLHSPHRLHQE